MACSLGVQQLIVAVNKLDNVDYSQVPALNEGGGEWREWSTRGLLLVQGNPRPRSGPGVGAVGPVPASVGRVAIEVSDRE